MSSFEGQATELIPAVVRMISGCQDSQTSADVSNVSAFQLPDPNGQAGGACTSALLKVLYNEHHKNSENLSFVDVLSRMRQVLSGGGYSQIPQLSSSRMMDLNEPFDIVPDNCTGTRRAVLVGINYLGQQGQLSGCHNDVGNIKDYLINAQGFDEDNITILMDDMFHESPTSANIISAFRKLTSETCSGDCAFFHYSGHGGRLQDDSGEEDDAYDETLIPVDYLSAGQIRDDVVYTELVGRMPEGSTLTCLLDCCHSGSVLDLPYTFKADGTQETMEPNPKTNFGKIQQLAISYIIAKLCGNGQIGHFMKTIMGGVGNCSGNSSSGNGASLGVLQSVFGMIKCG